MTPDTRIRALAAADLDAVVAIDAAAQGRTRRDYLERRLAAAQREPALHAQFAADDAQGLVGFILARVMIGEFGRSRAALRLEVVGLREGASRRGTGRALFDALAQWAQRHGIGEVRSLATWHETPMLGWFAAMGFELAAEVVVASAVEGGAERAERSTRPDDDEGEGGTEVDYGRPSPNDHDRLLRDRADVRSMQAADLDAIVRIDRGITGHDRREYISTRLAEALAASGVRVSLTARLDGVVAGYLMARADLGDFGRTEPVAVIDTIGVDPGFAHRRVGRALLSQLFANLGALRVEQVETVVPLRQHDLLGFVLAAGFAPSQRLSFVRRLAG